MLLLHRFCGRPERGSGRFSAPSAHGILGGVGAAPTAGSGACRPASATLCRGDPPVRRRTARLPGASVRRDEPPRLPPWLRRRPSRTARRDRSRVRGLTHLSRPRVRLSDPRLPFTRRHHRHGRRRPCGTRGTSRPPWRCWPLPRRRSYPPHRWCTASAAPLGASPVILPPPHSTTTTVCAAARLLATAVRATSAALPGAAPALQCRRRRRPCRLGLCASNLAASAAVPPSAPPTSHPPGRTSADDGATAAAPPARASAAAPRRPRPAATPSVTAHAGTTATTAGSALDAADRSQERRARGRHPSVR